MASLAYRLFREIIDEKDLVEDIKRKGIKEVVVQPIFTKAGHNYSARRDIHDYKIMVMSNDGSLNWNLNSGRDNGSWEGPYKHPDARYTEKKAVEIAEYLTQYLKPHVEVRVKNLTSNIDIIKI